MITLIIFLIIGIFLGVTNTDRKGKKTRKDDLCTLLNVTWVIIVLYGLTILIGRGIINMNSYKQEYKDLNISSLVSKERMRGNFILGCGQIRTDDYYVTYGNFGDDLEKQIELKQTDTYIKQTDNESPKIKNYWWRKVRKETKSLWFWNFNADTTRWMVNSSNDLILIVPKNTIFQQFSINK